MNIEDLYREAESKGEIAVFRGLACEPGEVEAELGHAWTIDPEVAGEYAGEEGCILAVSVGKHQINFDRTRSQIYQYGVTEFGICLNDAGGLPEVSVLDSEGVTIERVIENPSLGMLCDETIGELESEKWDDDTVWEHLMDADKILSMYLKLK